MEEEEGEEKELKTGKNEKNGNWKRMETVKRIETGKKQKDRNWKIMETGKRGKNGNWKRELKLKMKGN